MFFTTLILTIHPCTVDNLKLGRFSWRSVTNQGTALMSYEIGIDVGGTFTDFVVRSSDEIISGKVLTTPNDETAGIMNAIRTSAIHFDLDTHAFLTSADNLVLGTTVVTNAMLEYAGARTGLITTKGFRDIIELRTGYKEDHFDIRLPRPTPSYPGKDAWVLRNASTTWGRSCLHSTSRKCVRRSMN